MGGDFKALSTSDGVRGRGAPPPNLSHADTFHSWERITPSNRGIKHRFCPAIPIGTAHAINQIGGSRASWQGGFRPSGPADTPRR